VATDKHENGTIEKAFSLWNGRGKVKYSAIVREEITIPAGAKVLVFDNDGATAENKRPAINVCFVPENQE